MDVRYLSFKLVAVWDEVSPSAKGVTETVTGKSLKNPTVSLTLTFYLVLALETTAARQRSRLYDEEFEDLKATFPVDSCLRLDDCMLMGYDLCEIGQVLGGNRQLPIAKKPHFRRRENDYRACLFCGEDYFHRFCGFEGHENEVWHPATGKDQGCSNQAPRCMALSVL